MSRSYPSRPIVGVGAVVWKGDEVLLVRRARPPRIGSWTLPGGAQALGETIAEAIHREVREETGIEIRLLDVVAVVDLMDRDAKGNIRFHYTVVDFVAEWSSGEARPGDDADSVVWIPPRRLHEYAVTDQVVSIIAEAANKRTLVASS